MAPFIVIFSHPLSFACFCKKKQGIWQAMGQWNATGPVYKYKEWQFIIM